MIREDESEVPIWHELDRAGDEYLQSFERDLSSAGMYILKQRSIKRRHVYTQAEIYQSPACIYSSRDLSIAGMYI